MPWAESNSYMFIFFLGLSLAIAVEVAAHFYRMSIRRRLRHYSRPTAPASSSLAGKFDWMMGRWLTLMLPECAWKVRTSNLVIFGRGLLISIMAGIVLRLLDFTLTISVLGSVISLPFAHRYLVLADQERQGRQFKEQFPETLDMFVRMLRAGLPVQNCLERISIETSDGTSDVYKDVRGWLNMGLPLAEAFLKVSDRIRIAEFEFLGRALSIQAAAGGNLATALESLAQIIREKLMLALKSRALTGEARMTAYIIAALPLLVFLALRVFAPDYLDPILDGSNGYGLLGFILITYSLGVIIIRSMVAKLERL